MIDFVVPFSKKYKWCVSASNTLLVKHFDETEKLNLINVDLSDYKKQDWCNGMINFLNSYQNDFFVLMLEDYFVCRDISCKAIEILYEVANKKIIRGKKILRIDLTTDRLYAGGVQDIFSYKYFDFVEAKDSQYQMSLQAGLWNAKLLKEVLEKLNKENRSPWDVEIIGTGIVNSADYPVVGTRQNLIKYVNARNNNSNITNLNGLSVSDMKSILDYIPDDDISNK
jgi:hypothetical protein